MASNLFVLKDVTDFAPGAFENTAVENGAIRLGRSSGAYLPAGTYTGPAFTADSFLRVLPSWNADTPPGTWVEVEARIATGGRWSRWFSFGKWSPFIKRTSPEPHGDDLAQADGEYIAVRDGKSAAAVAQIRVHLATNDAEVTPAVHLLGLSTEPVRGGADTPDETNRLLEIPTYSCLVRDPSIAGRIATPTALAMLMNRWGEDVLPEEVARAMYDYGAGRFGNLAFVSAAAGMFGYECYPQFCKLGIIQREVRHGRAVAARVHYRAPALSSEEEEETEAAQGPAAALPLLENAAMDSFGHLVVVRGFKQKDGEEWVCLNDPLASSDEQVFHEMPVAVFTKIYTGLSYFLHRGPKLAGAGRPVRLLTQVQIEQGKLHLSTHGVELEPGRSIPGKTSAATICYTLFDGTAYASAAQKKFYYLSMDENKEIHLRETGGGNKKMTLYLIGGRGTTWVGETKLQAEKDKQTT